MPSSIEPEQPASVTISEASGKPMTYTLAIVDEGLLDLTRFKTPDPHAAFYAREALGVMSWDLFDDVIGAWGGDLERILGIGGDEGLRSEEHTSELQSLMRSSYAVFCLKKKNKECHEH